MTKRTNEELIERANKDEYDPNCTSHKNAVKIACKDSDPQNPGKACLDALKEYAECIDNNG